MEHTDSALLAGTQANLGVSQIKMWMQLQQHHQFDVQRPLSRDNDGAVQVECRSPFQLLAPATMRRYNIFAYHHTYWINKKCPCHIGAVKFVTSAK